MADIRERLIERTCELIMTEGQFDMSTFDGQGLDSPVCGTACCMAGNLVIAGRELGLLSERIPARLTERHANELWCTILGYAPVDDCGGDWFASEVSFGDVTPELACAHIRTGRPLKELFDEAEANNG